MYIPQDHHDSSISSLVYAQSSPLTTSVAMDISFLKAVLERRAEEICMLEQSVVNIVALEVCSGKATVRYRLGRPRCSDRLRDLGYLVAGADDFLTLAILVELDVLVFPLCALPNLDFTTASDNTYSHG